MSAANIQTLIGMIAYLIAMITIGLWYARRSNTSLEEYFLANRRFGPWIASLSAEASDMSGWLLMGLPGVAYLYGIADAFWTALGLFIGTWINWAVVAKRLRAYSQIADNAITLPEFFSKRFHDKKRVLLAIAAVISLVFFSIYVGAQLKTFGKLFNHVFSANMTAMIILGAIVILAYTLLGGFWAVGMTDLIQGLLMIGALVLVMVFGVFKAGGIGAVADKLRNFPSFTEFFGMANPVMTDGVQQVSNGAPVFGPGINYGFLTIISTMAWGLGYFGMPQVLVRFMAIKEKKMIKRSVLIAVIWCFIAQFAAVAIGLIGRAIKTGGLLDHETIFIFLGQAFFPPLLTGIIISGILAASMSSADSYMLIVSSSLANDIFKDILKKDASDKQVMWVGRITMLLVTTFGIIIAATGSDSIFRVVSYAWAGLGASFGPLILFSLFWKRTTFPAAVSGMVAGGAMVFFWKNVIRPIGGAWNIYELLPAFVISCIVIVVVSLLTDKPSAEIESEFEKAKTLEF